MREELLSKYKPIVDAIYSQSIQITKNSKVRFIVLWKEVYGYGQTLFASVEEIKDGVIQEISVEDPLV